MQLVERLNGRSLYAAFLGLTFLPFACACLQLLNISVPLGRSIILSTIATTGALHLSLAIVFSFVALAYNLRTEARLWVSGLRHCIYLALALSFGVFLTSIFINFLAIASYDIDVEFAKSMAGRFG